MSRFATVIEIAGVPFTGCRGLLVDGQGFADSDKGSVEWALDSTPQPQRFDTLHRGSQFGIVLGTEEGSVEIAKANQLIAAIKQSKAQGYFSFLYVDEQYNLNLKVVQDYTQQWYQYGRFSEGYVQSVTLRMIVREAVSVTYPS